MSPAAGKARRSVNGRAGRFALAAAVLVLAGAGRPALAQTRPFVFTVAPAPASSAERWTVHYDAGYGQGASGPFGYDGMEQRVGLQGALGHGLTLVGQVGLGLGGDRRASHMQQVEVLEDVTAPSRAFRLAAGVGVRREWEGQSVLLGRVAAGRSFAGSALFGNVRFERPLVAGRDAMDVVTSLGWLRRLGPAVHLGVEGVGEDLEGLWEKDEAEGGAKLFLGPSLHVRPPGQRWSASLCGGPIVYASRSGRTSDASRALGTAGGNGYTARLSVGYSF